MHLWVADACRFLINHHASNKLFHIHGLRWEARDSLSPATKGDKLVSFVGSTGNQEDTIKFARTARRHSCISSTFFPTFPTCNGKHVHRRHWSNNICNAYLLDMGSLSPSSRAVKLLPSHPYKRMHVKIDFSRIFKIHLCNEICLANLCH